MMGVPCDEAKYSDQLKLKNYNLEQAGMSVTPCCPVIICNCLMPGLLCSRNWLQTSTLLLMQR